MGIHENGYDLEYLPDAHSWVDPIKNLHGLMGQRKRWINGSFFAFEAVKRGFKEHDGANFCLKLQIVYLSLMNMMAFVAPAIFLFTIHVAMSAFRDWFFFDLMKTIIGFSTNELYNSFVYVIDFIYILIMLAFVFKSMHFTHRTERFIPFTYIVSTIMGIFSIIVFIVLITDMLNGMIDAAKCIKDISKCSFTCKKC
jgi:cellulose synthase/poly-beta-1,6-N-acetylglucosamine synthase-like glycosyltransferase